MNNDERIKKKLGKLLTKWSVTDEEKVEFLKELEEEIAKPDDEEDLESVTEETEEVEEENPTEEVGEEEVSEEVGEDAEEPGEELEPTEPVGEPIEEPVAEEPQAEEQPSEVQLGEQPMEQPAMDQPMEQPQDNSNEVAELKTTIDGLLDRISSLEDLVKKLGTPVEENIGVEPRNPSGESLQESELDRFNRLRMGR